MTADATFNPKSVLELDGWLEPFLPVIQRRCERFQRWKDIIHDSEGGYDSFSKGYLKFGFNVQQNNDIIYREWAPNAKEAYIIGDFSTSLAHHMLSRMQRIFT